MNNGNIRTYNPSIACPPDRFAGRENEQKIILEILSGVENQGKALMISGGVGLGKTSYLNWIENTIQNELGSENIVIKNDLTQVSGKVFATYVKILHELKGHGKYGWFKNFINDHIKQINSVIALLSSVPGGQGPQQALQSYMPQTPVNYVEFEDEFLKILEYISTEMKNNGVFLAIVLDNVHFSSQEDFNFLNSIIRRIPPSIVLIFTFECSGNELRYNKLKREIKNLGHLEIQLKKFNAEEIKDFAAKKYKKIIDDKSAEFLSNRVGEPRSLVEAFERVIERKLDTNYKNFKEILPKAIILGEVIFLDLERKFQKWATNLCLIDPPIPIKIISCLVSEPELSELEFELDDLYIFHRAGDGFYDFSYPSLREYCINRLSEPVKKDMIKKNEKCLENLQEEISIINQPRMFNISPEKELKNVSRV